MLRSGTGAIGMSYFGSGQLLQRAIKGTPDAAVSWLEAILSKQGAGYWAMPLWGVTVDVEVPLGENLKLVPMSSLPASAAKAQFEASYTFPTSYGGFRWSPPAAAFVAETTIDPLFCRSDELSNLQLEDPAARFEEARLCLALTGPRTLVAERMWFEFADPEIASIGMSGYRSSHREIEPIQVTSDLPLDVEKAHSIYTRYRALETDSRARVHLCIERFDRAMHRRDPGDKALELAIALEVLLGDGSSELSWKVSLRSALLVGGTTTERARTRAVVHALRNA